MDSYHENINCDVCSEQNITGVCYICLICNNYDLCEDCYNERRFNRQHKAYHPMQPVLPELEFLESTNETAPEDMRIYVCPYCDDRDFNQPGLFNHCQRYHSEDVTLVRCPLCSVYDVQTRDMHTILLEHLLDLHVEYSEPAGGTSESTPEDPECSICMEIVPRTSNGKSLPCSHRFHSTCIDRWLEENQTCPVCRIAA